MRYPEGTVELNGEHDLPLLRQLAHSRFVTRSQLAEYQSLRGSDECRRSFNWRIKRLMDHGFVDRRTVPALGAEYIYSLTTHGALRLEEIEERFSFSLSAERNKAGDLRVIHSVELNNIQLRAARAALLGRWIPDAEIRSENEIAGLSYKKEYDAVVTLRFDGRDITFALECERTIKSRERYDKIAASVCAEREVEQFLT